MWYRYSSYWIDQLFIFILISSWVFKICVLCRISDHFVLVDKYIRNKNCFDLQVINFNARNISSSFINLMDFFFYFDIKLFCFSYFFKDWLKSYLGRLIWKGQIQINQIKFSNIGVFISIVSCKRTVNAR